MKFIIIILCLIFLSGCEDFPVYEEFTTHKKTFECLRVDINDTALLKSIKSELKFDDDKNCPYVLGGYIHHSTTCTSLYAKTYGTDFNGYVYLEIKKDGDRLYRIQSDFKEDLLGAISRVVTKVNRLVK